MDLILWSLVSLGILAYISFVFLSHARKTNHQGRKLPPGETGWPIIGESLKFISAGKKGTPESFIRERISKYSPELFKTSIAGEKMVVFCGAAGNKFLFSNENKLVVSWRPSTIGKILKWKGRSLALDRKKWLGVLSQYLKMEELKYYVPLMDQSTKRYMAEEWIPNQAIKAFPLTKKLAFCVSCRLFMNIKDVVKLDYLAHQFALMMAGIFAAPIDFPGTTFNRAIKAANRIREELYPIIKHRKGQLLSETSSGADKLDFLSHLVVSTKDDEMFLDEIADSILALLAGSHDTTSSAMASVIYFLADHPHVYNRVLEEQMEIAKSKEPLALLDWNDVQKMKYSRNVINEVLRLVPPSPGGMKEVISDFTYAGFRIPKGWKTFWSVHSTHKDPNYFENPEKFDPSRFEGKGPMPYAFVPFGVGPHMCPASEFARLKILVFIHNLVTRFRWEKLVQNEKIIYNPTPIMVNGLPIRLLPHN